MQYRELARTGLRVSEIGLGCEGFSGKTQAEATGWIHTALASVMVSVYTMEELQDCLHYEQASAEERDYAMALAAMPEVHVLWPLHTLPPWHGCGDGHQAPEPSQGTGRDTGNGARALCGAGTQGRGMQRLRRVRKEMLLRHGDPRTHARSQRSLL